MSPYTQSPEDSEGQRSPVCCGPWGHEESDTTERLSTAHIRWTGGLSVMYHYYPDHCARSCCTTKWISYRCTAVFSLWSLPPIHPSRPPQSAEPSSLWHAAASHQLFYAPRCTCIDPNLPIHRRRPHLHPALQTGSPVPAKGLGQKRTPRSGPRRSLVGEERLAGTSHLRLPPISLS